MNIGGLFLMLYEHCKRQSKEPVFDLERDSAAITAGLVCFLAISLLFCIAVIYVAFS